MEEHHETPLSSAKDKLPTSKLMPYSPRQMGIASDMADYMHKLGELNDIKELMDLEVCKRIGLDLWRISVRSGTE